MFLKPFVGGGGGGVVNALVIEIPGVPKNATDSKFSHKLFQIYNEIIIFLYICNDWFKF